MEKDMPKPTPKLERTTFITSKELEYFSVKELSRELGSNSVKWPLVLTKELIDNALDACETSDIAPAITVTLEGTMVCVADNGPGLPESTLRASLNYNSRTSDKAHYISPTRGQIGNALKCLWAGPFVYNLEYGNDERGSVTVTTPLYSYEITVAVDKIQQKPKLIPVLLDREFVKTGTLIEIEWKAVAGYIPVEIADFYNSDEDEDKDGEIEDEEVPPPRTFAEEVQFLLESYATFNPHATFYLRRDGQTITVAQPLLPGWNKWRTDDPTSPHWYDADELRTLIAGYISNEKGTMTVREFVKEFRYLSGTAKQKAVVAAANLSGQCLNDLVSNDDIDISKVKSLLKALQVASRPVKAAMMGLIGAETLSRRLSEIDGAVSEGIQYVKVPSEDARPTLIEVVFGVRRDDNGGRRMRFGLNCSPAFECPVQGLESFLQYGLSIDPDAPISMAVHIMRPGLEFTSRAKSMLT